MITDAIEQIATEVEQLEQMRDSFIRELSGVPTGTTESNPDDIEVAVRIIRKEMMQACARVQKLGDSCLTLQKLIAYRQAAIAQAKEI